MRVYETTFIVNPQTDDATIDQHVSAVSDLITGRGGKLLHEDRMGTRRLAYPIRKLTQGYYHSFIYEAPHELLPELERHFRLNDQYLRFLTILFEGDITKLTQERPAAGETAERPHHRARPRPEAREESSTKEPEKSEESTESTESTESAESAESTDTDEHGDSDDSGDSDKSDDSDDSDTEEEL